MNAPELWQQILIVLIVLSLLPAIIAILAKLRILPIAIYLLIADGFPKWFYANARTAATVLAICIAYPVLTLLWKLYRSRKEEQEAAEYLLATGHHWYLEPEPAFDTMTASELGLSEDEDMDW